MADPQYTPNTPTVRDHYALSRYDGGRDFDTRRAEFDRWHQADRAAAVEEKLRSIAHPEHGDAEEDARLVAQAMRCVNTGNATNWPTVAGVLADEIDRLRAELALQTGALHG